MNVKESHIVTGMSRDSAVSQQNPNLVYDAHNIRITTKDGKNSLLSVTNERGTRQVSLTEDSDSIVGTPIGDAVIDNTLVLFTHDAYAESNPDHIYKCVVDDDHDIIAVTKIFEGDANFDLEHPIETLSVFEAESIQKVYWVDGKNQPRMINIVTGCAKDNSNNYIVDSLNFSRTINLSHSMTIEKRNTAGSFPSGTIQYAVSYYNKFAQETNIFEISPMYYLSPKDRGIAADKTTQCSFKIVLSNLDSNFEYVRLYSIVRPIANGTPLCKIVGDYKIGDTDLIIIDSNTTGRTIDSTMLFFIGGEELVANTLTQKDNTLFLGNISINRPVVGNVKYNDEGVIKTIKEHTKDAVDTARADITEGNYYFGTNNSLVYSGVTYRHHYYSVDAPDATLRPHPTGNGFYNYTPDNNRSSRFIKRFKYGEVYRLGFIAQYKNGKWSEAIWLKDDSTGTKPVDSTSDYYTGAFVLELRKGLSKALLDAGFVKVAPVVVYPKNEDRIVVAQGLLSPTVYNVIDRNTNSPYAQSSWFFRLFNAEGEKNSSGDVVRQGCYASAHNAALYTSNNYKSEIQSNCGLRPYVPLSYDDEGTTISNKDKFLGYFGNYFFVDSNILTFHSPDIDSSEELRQEGFNGLKLDIVGKAIVQEQKTDTFISVNNVGINADESQILHFNLNSRIPTLAMYADNAVNTNNLNEVIGVGNYDYLYGWATYPWHREGSLNNQGNLTTKQKQSGYTSKTAVLKRKIESTLWYALPEYNTNFIVDPDFTITTPQLFSDDQLSAIRIPTSNGESYIYYGNIDKVLSANTCGENAIYVPKLNDNGEWSNISYTFTTAGYYILRHWWKKDISHGGSSGWTGTAGDIPEITLSLDYQNKYKRADGNIDRQFDTSPFSENIYDLGPDNTVDATISKDPVHISYKSTPHLVFALDENETTQKALPTFARNNVMKASYIDGDTTTTRRYRYWDEKQKNVVPIVSAPYTDNKRFLFIAELRRKLTTDFALNRMGGLSMEAFTESNWIRCGESVSLVEGERAQLVYTEGDTYFQRYDCLKTYPFSEEATNSVIEIFSTSIETRVNLDFSYNKNRGLQSNISVNNNNFNLFNHLAYEQDNNFFTYHSLDYDRFSKSVFPATVTWSLEKQFGEDVDTWASIDVSNTLEMDGNFGKINKLVNYNNDVYSFQNIGFAQLLFNSRVQIPTSDGVPIEITNGMKMQGKRYISTKIGCINKWSIVETPMGVYFNDDILKATYMFNGQLADLSTTKGMKSWMNESCNNKVWNPEDFDNCKAFYDKAGRDVYWIYGNTALVYSEILGQYMSFMDYGNVPLLTSLCNSTYAITNSYGVKKLVNLTIPFQTEGGVANGTIAFTLSDDHTGNVNLIVNWLVDTTPGSSRPTAEVQVSTSGNTDVIAITIYTYSTYSAELYTLGDILTAIQNGLPSYITAALNVSGEYRLAYRDSGAYEGINTYMTNNSSSPIWELGKGNYNMFFGEHKPYWLTLISNTQPTENKIYNNVAWRDIVTENLNTKPFRTFDHIRVWNEHQDTQSVRFSNSLSIDSSRQPIAYNAAISNLRKKFNVWHCQIPRDKLALNTSRARISNPWTYIKLSREDVYTDRHEIMDIEVDYFM